MAAKPRKKRRERDRLGRKKKCFFTENGYSCIDYKDIDLLKRFVTERGKISPRRNTGTCANTDMMTTKVPLKAIISYLIARKSTVYCHSMI